MIRPYLCQISTAKSSEQSYQHLSNLSKLIKILYSCFNEQLKVLLTQSLKQLQESIMEDYKIPFILQPLPEPEPADGQPSA